MAFFFAIDPEIYRSRPTQIAAPFRNSKKNPLNSNSYDNVYAAVIMALPLREFTRFFWATDLSTFAFSYNVRHYKTPH